MGLGLVKAIVEAHGGQVDARSTVDVGSVFTVTLPVKADSPVEAPGESDRLLGSRAK